MEMTQEQIKWFDIRREYLASLQKEKSNIFLGLALQELQEEYDEEFQRNFLEDLEKYAALLDEENEKSL